MESKNSDIPLDESMKNSSEYSLADLKLMESLENAAKEWQAECDTFWEGLSYEDKLKAFGSVVRRIVKGDIEDRGTYRHVLYSVFQFDLDAYGYGMECGYLDLHNAIYTPEEIKKLRGSGS